MPRPAEIPPLGSIVRVALVLVLALGAGMSYAWRLHAQSGSAPHFEGVALLLAAITAIGSALWLMHRRKHRDAEVPA